MRCDGPSTSGIPDMGNPPLGGQGAQPFTLLQYDQQNVTTAQAALDQANADNANANNALTQAQAQLDAAQAALTQAQTTVSSTQAAVIQDQATLDAAQAALAQAQVAATCGNGLLEPGEECDDGNVISGDGCSATCTVEAGYACSGSPSVCMPVPAAGAGTDNTMTESCVNATWPGCIGGRQGDCATGRACAAYTDGTCYCRQTGNIGNSNTGLPVK